MSPLGYKQTSSRPKLTSASPPTTDIRWPMSAVVIGNQRHTDSSLCQPDSQAIHPCSEHYVIHLPVSTKIPVCPALPDNP